MNSVAAKIEKPKNEPVSAAELAMKFEALRNDIPPEKLAEAKIKADFEKLEGKIATITKARKAGVEELEKINQELEALKRSLEIRQFEERFSASEAVIRYLQANPEVKPENIKPSDVKITNPELQKPEVWKNIVEDAVRGLAVVKTFENPNFDWKNPKAYLDKSEGIGKDILEVAKKNPVLTGICVIGGLYALYQFFAENGIWSKVKGAVVGGGSVLLGLSLFGNLDLKKEAQKWFLDGMIDPKHQKEAEKIVDEIKRNTDGLKDKADDALGPNENPVDAYDQHTQIGVEKIRKEKRYEEAWLYRLMRDYAKSNGIAVSREEILTACEKLENGEDLPNYSNYLTLVLGENSIIKMTEWGAEILPHWGFTALSAGGYLAYKIIAEELQYFKNLEAWWDNRNVENASKFFGQWGKNAIIVTGVLTAWDYLAKPHGVLLSLPINVGKGIVWPVYGLEIAGKGISKSAQFFGKPRLLGRWESTGKILNFIDTTGKFIAKVNPTTLVLETWNGGKWMARKILGETPISQTEAKTATPEVKEATQHSFFRLKAEQLQRKTPDEIKKLSASIEEGISKLEDELTQLTADSPDRLRKLEELKALRCDLDAIRVYLDPKAYAETKLSSLENFEKLDSNQKALAIKDAAAQMESLEVGQSAQFRAKIEAAKKSFDAGHITQEQFKKKLAALDQEAINFGKSKLAKIKELKAAQKKLPKDLQKSVQKEIARAIDNLDSSLCARVIKGAKGRGKMVVLMASGMFAIDKAIHWNDADSSLMKELERLGPDLKQLLLDVSPVAGTFSNFYSAFSGKEMVSGRDVSGAWDRVSNVIWGSVSAVGDVITVVSAIPSGGASLGGAALIRLGAIASRGGKLAKPAEFLMKNWSKVAALAEKTGGWRKFLSKLGESEKTMQGLRKIETVGMIAGTTMIAGSVASLTYGFLSEGSDSEIPE